MNEINNRIKGTVGDFFKDFKPQEAKVNSSVNMSSTKKMLNKKAKTEKLEDGTEKRKINYNIKGDESDGASDSQPSDDNLDQDEILKLIPKKFGKSKYLKGEEEKKKKKVPKTEQKPKKPQTVLMPCMSAKKENDAKTLRNSSVPAVQKKIAAAPAFKLISWEKRNGGKQRDVGTHIRYQGDGKSLSLMEMDILRTTGCKWSKIIFPGFKGYLRPHEKDMMHRSPMIDPKIEGFLSQSPADKGLSSFMESFNKEYNKIVDGSANSGLRNSVGSRGKSHASETNLKIGASPFSNELLQQQL